MIPAEIQKTGIDPPRLGLHPLRPAAEHESGHDRDDKDRDHDAGPRLQHRRRNVEAAVGEEYRVADADRLARRREGGHHDPVHEQDVEQHRDVPGELEEHVDDAVDEPVPGQTQDPQRHPERGGGHDSTDRDEQGVEDADRRRDQVRVAGGVVDERGEGDVVGGGGGQEVEAEFLSDRLEVDRDVAEHERDQREDDRHRGDLDDDRSRLLVAPEPGDQPAVSDGRGRHRRMFGRAVPARPGGAPAPCSSLVQGVYQRNGGEYWRPPSVQRALRPRSRPIGVLTPMLRSKISP